MNQSASKRKLKRNQIIDESDEDEPTLKHEEGKQANK